MKQIRRIVFSGITGFILAFCFVAGKPLDIEESLDLLDKLFYIKWFLCGVGFSVFCYLVWSLMNRFLGKRFGKVRGFFTKLKSPAPLFCVLIMLLCWLPALLSIFPGVFSYDAYDEWQQIVQGTISAHHPVLHVLLLGGLVEGIHTLTGSYNVGIATYTILQMILLASMLSWSISLLKRFHKTNPLWQYVALIVFCLSPVIQLFSICSTKDVLFASSLLLFTEYIYCFYSSREAFFQEKRNYIGFIVTAFLSMILRNNGLYIVLIVCIAMLLHCIIQMKEHILRFLGILLGVVAIFVAYIGPFYHVLSVKPGGVQEMLSVPLQQMARTYRYNIDSVEASDVELLYSFVPKEYLEKYRPTVSDFVKAGFQVEEFDKNKTGFIKLWAKWGIEHPLVYVNSFLINTVDVWYPFAIVDGYRNETNNYFDYKVAEPGTEVVLFPTIHSYYKAISEDKAVQQNKFSFLIFSPGWLFVVNFFLFMYCWCYRKYRLFVPLTVALLNFLTVLLGPVAFVRYVLIFFFELPALLAWVYYEPNYKRS